MSAYDLLIFPALPGVDGCGELAIRRHYPERPGDGRGWVTIERADPRVFIPAEDAWDIALGEWQAFARIRSARDVVAGFPLAGSTLEICGEDARVIYVLTVRLDLYGYIAQWPD